VATVSAQGLVTAVMNGTAQITAKAGNASASVAVTVAQSAVRITITPPLATLMAIGETVQLTAAVLDQNGQPVEGAVVTWSSSDEAVATVSPQGLVTAVMNGDAQITARAGTASTSIDVTVMQAAGSIVIEPADATLMAIGETVQLTATVLDQNGHPVEGAVVIWSSSNEAVATVSPQGLVTAVMNGAVQITARAGTASTSIDVTVMQAAGSIVIEPEEATLMAIGETVQLTAAVLDRNGQPVEGAVITWSSSDENIATVTPQGLVTAVMNGVAQITAHAGTVTSHVTVQVTDTQRDRDALIALYHATNGSNWTNSTNWLSDQPVGDWHGVLTNAQGEVIKLVLSQNNVQGVVPHEIGQLLNLNWLNLSDNQLSGSIPSEIGRLLNLTFLNLSDNQLSGSIPSEIGQLLNLRDLNLSNNLLAGSIPPEIGQLQNLTLLWLYGNQLTGPIPSEIGQLQKLTSLALDGNQLSGSIPSEIGRLLNLTFLNLSDNQLAGSIPPEIGQLLNLRDLNLSNNQLAGIIPPEIGQLQKLTTLWLGDNQLTGNIPPEIGELQNLTDLNLGANQLSGPIPTVIGQLQKLTGLFLYGNSLTGNVLPEIGQLQKLTILWLDGNQLTGSIPHEIGQLLNLTFLNLSNNQLAGSIPHEIGQLRNLTDLNLDFNQLSGSIPPVIGQLQHLRFLRLNGNQLTGSIPSEIGQNSMLRVLNLAFNPGLSGPLPETFTTLSNMEYLSLHYTQVCIPPTAQFQSWLDGIEDIRGDISSCPGPEGPEEPEEPEMPPPVGERLDVRIVYFVPANHTGYPNIDAKIDSLVNIVKLTYAEIFEFHGFGDRTFQHEQNADGTARVYYVKGQYDGEYYSSDTFSKVIFTELEQIFDLEANIYWVVLDAIDASVDGYCGQGHGTLPEGGAFLIPGPNDYWLEDRGWSCFNPSVASHEIGHSFGLAHDLLRDEVRVESSYQDDWMITSYGAAEWMSVHPYFTGEPTTGNDNEGEISLRSISDASSETIRLVFDVSDPDMLHQAQLHDRNGDLIAYRGLDGESATAVFETDQVSYGDQILLRTIDKRAFVGYGEFIIDRDGPITVRQLQTGRPFKPQH